MANEAAMYAQQAQNMERRANEIKNNPNSTSGERASVPNMLKTASDLMKEAIKLGYRGDADGEDKDWTESRLERLEKDEARLKEEAPDADREEIREIYAEMQNIAREKKHLGKVVDRAQRRAADAGEDEDEEEAAEEDKRADEEKPGDRISAGRELKVAPGTMGEIKGELYTPSEKAYMEMMRKRGGGRRTDASPQLAACQDAVDKIARRLDSLEKDCRMDVTTEGTNMPSRRGDAPVSEAQRRAMRAAAAGNSTEGIPASVGKEFSEKDPGGKLPGHK